MNRSSGHVRRTQSMPQQPTAGPPPQPLRRVATAVLADAHYSSSDQHAQARAAVAYPYPIHNPTRDVYYNPTSVAGLPGHRSPIDQQREQLEQYNRNRVPTNYNYNSTVRSGTTSLDAEARQLEEAIALSLIESTRPASHSRPVSVSSNDHSYRSDRTFFEEQDPAQRILLETTHMTPEELADEKALQEAILISLRDAELEQARALSYMDRDVAPERSASTHRTHHFQQEQSKEYFPAAVPQRRSTSTHRAHHHFHQEQASEHYPSVHHEMSREHLHHSSRHIHHEPNIARYQQQEHHHQQSHYHQQEETRVHDHTVIHRDPYGHAGHVSHHMQVPSYPAPPARDYPHLRPPSQPISPLTYRSRSSSADSSVVDDSTQISGGPVGHAPPPVFGLATLRAPPPLVHLDSHESPSANSSVTDQRSKVSASSAAAVVHPPPPVFGHATLRAPPPLVHLDSHDQASANSSVTDERSKVSAASAVSDVRPPPPVFGHATLRAPPPVLPTELVHNGVRHQ
eukprot:CAMPEP_0184974030 /NCGR_PEP_ID=MMETSP1098-20130426/5603_1 /TAXON_ID=89044 /ORGANISM="Spumella elongata, Strain CCAP 955/1" /LENGTH=513 /DNA_ID=CAMNT_0027496551 /DNA_START=109 /DNA_END=1650 /DNA_ORIENTATION=-